MNNYVLVDELQLIVNARDHHADTGSYPPSPKGPSKNECFDDWAADIVEFAITTLTGKPQTF